MKTTERNQYQVSQALGAATAYSTVITEYHTAPWKLVMFAVNIALLRQAVLIVQNATRKRYSYIRVNAKTRTNGNEF